MQGKPQLVYDTYTMESTEYQFKEYTFCSVNIENPLKKTFLALLCMTLFINSNSSKFHIQSFNTWARECACLTPTFTLAGLLYLLADSQRILTIIV